MGNTMKNLSKIHFILALLAFIFGSKLKGQYSPLPVDYNISSDFELPKISPILNFVNGGFILFP